MEKEAPVTRGAPAALIRLWLNTYRVSVSQPPT